MAKITYLIKKRLRTNLFDTQIKPPKTLNKRPKKLLTMKNKTNKTLIHIDLIKTNAP